MSDPIAAPVRPLVVCGPDGRPLGILEENEKGYRKSIERNRLWALHPGTGRLLPFYEETPVTVAERDGWYEAVLDEVPGEAGVGRPGESASRPREAAGADAGASSASPEPRGGSDPAIGAVLETLVGVIASRHAEMPEGSYTTHLFESGAEKIRKKTGEEAVELILASTRETIVSESADLIYHLLVLLESEGISLGELAAELGRR